MLMKFAPREPTNTNNSTTPSRFEKLELEDPWTDVFFVLLIVGCMIMSLGTVTLPTLGGDQVTF